MGTRSFAIQIGRKFGSSATLTLLGNSPKPQCKQCFSQMLRRTYLDCKSWYEWYSL